MICGILLSRRMRFQSLKVCAQCLGRRKLIPAGDHPLACKDSVICTLCGPEFTLSLFVTYKPHSQKNGSESRDAYEVWLKASVPEHFLDQYSCFAAIIMLFKSRRELFMPYDVARWEKPDPYVSFLSVRTRSVESAVSQMATFFEFFPQNFSLQCYFFAESLNRCNFIFYYASILESMWCMACVILRAIA